MKGGKYMKRTGALISALLLGTASLVGCGVSSQTLLTYQVADFTPKVYEPVAESLKAPVTLMGEEVCVISGLSEGLLQLSEDPDAYALLAIQDDDNELLYQKNVHERLYPASLTKLMTAYVAYEKITDFSQEYTIPKEATILPDIYAKKCGLKEGDIITLEELMHAALIPSANDAAKALAMAVSGTEEEFVKEMNEAAKKLGATQTHFSNCHGLHVDDHYTTLYDMYLIFHALLENEDFVSIVNKATHDLTYKDSLGNTISKAISSTNQYHTGAVETPSFFSVVGGKTGTTNQAGSCMMIYCQDLSGNGYILAVLNASDKTELYSNFQLLFESINNSQ